MAVNSTDQVRGLGLWSATAMVIGDTIGTGIFLLASDMARAAGSATLVLAAWIFWWADRIFGCSLFMPNWARHFQFHPRFRTPSGALRATAAIRKISGVQG